ncbi:flagellar hook-basal body protein [Brevibacillus humidisoli]|uniref:flagellar hook-basal body protein n=1 Tax=Brevibacillus humidisoli TaxID=2895522 RepID=UPI001E548DAA|nr:flagellar hook-basal body protein [Brevibacillus humidisoli]UFJ40139.1 flagellar hook-basal body protein [Brevibacillus humidisoli]
MQSLHISTSALRSIQYALDTTGNNLANLDTVGYKRRNASFSELLFDSMNEQPYNDRENRTTPPGLRIGSGVRLGETRLDMSQGNMKATDVPTDLMIEGEGFFLVRRMDNPDEYVFTRNGAFQLMQNTSGTYSLVNASGDKLVGEDGFEVELDIDPSDTISISPDGRIMVNGAEEDPRIPVWHIPNPGQYRQIGDNEYVLTLPDGVNDPSLVMGFLNYENPEYPPAQENLRIGSKIRQGALEMSNVNLQEEMAKLVTVQRAYQLNARAVAISEQMMGIANSLRSR